MGGSRRLAALCCIACAAAIGACGGSEAEPDATAGSTATAESATATEAEPIGGGPKLGGCELPKGAEIERVSGALDVGVIGDGRATVVLSNQLDEGLCSWLEFATELERAGYTAIVYDYGEAGPGPAEAVAIASWLDRRGFEPVALMGASVGATSSILAAGEEPRLVDAVVSVSAVKDILPGVAAAAGRVRAPTLLLATRDDVPSDTDLGKLERAISVPGSEAELLRGYEHGTDLIAEAQASELALEFLDRRLGG